MSISVYIIRFFSAFLISCGLEERTVEVVPEVVMGSLGVISFSIVVITTQFLPGWFSRFYFILFSSNRKIKTKQRTIQPDSTTG